MLIYGLGAGVFTGCLAAALAEIVNVIPVMVVVEKQYNSKRQTNRIRNFQPAVPISVSKHKLIELLKYFVYACVLIKCHFTTAKIDSDPTPLQIQMRQYEQSEETTIIENASREGKKLEK